MMKYAITISAILLMITSSGCATAPSRRANELQIKQLQSRVNQLESEVGAKDEDIARLERKLIECEERSMPLGSQRHQAVYKIDETSTKMTVRQIQTALKKAGYYDGTVDGKMGPKTKEAIKEFQREYGLKADGVVGQKTRSKLLNYD